MVALYRGPSIVTLVVTHTMCPSIVLYTTGSMASTISSPVSLTLVTATYAASKSVVSSAVSYPYIFLIGCLIWCILYFHGLNNGLHLLELSGKLLLILLNFICNMGHVWLLNDIRSFNWHWLFLQDLLDYHHHIVYHICMVHSWILNVKICYLS